MKSFISLRQLFLTSIVSFISVFSVSVLFAQSPLSHQALQITGGYSKHGSGDMSGIVFGTEYIDYISPRVSLNYNFRGSINNSKHTILVTDNATGTHTDASIRFTTAGIQLGINGQYSIVRSRKHELLASLGAFGRYQSASNGSDGYALYGPAVTNLPTFLVGYDNRTPQKTYSVGGIFQLYYLFTFNNKILIGLAPGFQTDTNGDAIPQAVLTVGRRF